MVILLTILQVLVALTLILFVLLQSARGTDLAGAFGGMGSQAAFGPRGTATFLSKATVVLAVVFMANSLTLAILANRGVGMGQSILSGEDAAVPTAPAAPPEGTPVPVEGLPPGVGVTVVPEQPPVEAGDAAGAAPAQPASEAPSEPSGP